MRLQGRDAENAEEAQRKPQFHGDPALVAGWREQTERTGAGRRGKDRPSFSDGTSRAFAGAMGISRQESSAF